MVPQDVTERLARGTVQRKGGADPALSVSFVVNFASPASGMLKFKNERFAKLGALPYDGFLLADSIALLAAQAEFTTGR